MKDKLLNKKVVIVLILAILTATVVYFGVTDTNPQQPEEAESVYDISNPIDSFIIVQHIEGQLYDNLTIEVNYQDSEKERIEVDIDSEGMSDSVSLSSPNPTVAKLINNGEVIETVDFSSVDGKSSDSPKVQDIEDRTISLNNNLELNATDYIEDTDEVDGLRWKTGDSTNYTSTRISHKYESIGDYELTLTAINNSRDVSTTVGANIKVEFNAIRELQIDGDKKVGEELTFNGEETTTDAAQNLEWIIDGKFHSQTNTTYVFEDPGRHTVELLVETTRGNIETKFWGIDIDN